MNAAKKIKKSSLEIKRESLKERLGQPDYILEQMAQYLKEGDVASITDLISSYVSNSPKYANQQEFADAIDTSRQTLHRMFSHNEAVSMNVFIGAIEQIFQDAHA